MITRDSTSARLLLLAYLGVLGLLVFLPSGRGMDIGDRLNLDPFATIDRALQLGPRSGSFRLMIGNVAAFVPFGLLLPLAFRWAGLVMTLLATIVLSVAIELGQLGGSLALGYAYRSTDVDDVILNVTGGMAGFVVIALLIFAAGLSGRDKSAGHAK
jgi:glycopeptide antibiotics resistance protein